MQRSGFLAGFGRHRRNQQPAAFGRTMRTGGAGGTYTEIHYLRRSVEEATAAAGSLYVHWRRYTALSNVGRCPRCFDARRLESADPSCSVCLGTGWRHGFSRPSIQWMLINDTRTQIDLSSTGILNIRLGSSYSPGVPRMAPGDVLAKLALAEDAGEGASFGGRVGTHYETGDRYVITNSVDELRGRDQVDSPRRAADDHLDPEPEVYGYQFETSLIPRNTEDRFALAQHRLDHAGAVWLADPDEEVARI